MTLFRVAEVLTVAALSVAAPSAAAQRSALPSDSAALAAFADDFFAREMAERRIPGAVLVIVQGDQVVLSRGYGYADLDARLPVDPERTLFRIGSVSKLFTATAAMQLIERNRLSLHADVNTYLRSFSLPHDFEQPVTLHHLLTHTPGFEERLVGLGARPDEPVRQLSEVLARSMPARVRPPGQAVSYSNHGSSLAGLLVEEVSGLRFDEYVGREILQPLGMTRSGFGVGPELERDLARGYELQGGAYRPIPLDVIRLAPAGAFATTGSDMARFLIANLRGGSYGDARILATETLRMMHTPQVGDPDVAAWAYGYYVSSRTRQPLLMHTGGWRDFRSLLFLLTEADIGVFLSYNRADEGPLEMQEDFMQRFLARYVDDARTFTPTHHRGELDLGALEGRYRYIRRSHTSPEKILALIGAEVHVRRDGDTALVASGLSAAPVRLTPADGFRLRRDDGRGLVAFEQGSDGRALRLVAGPDLPVVYERIAWWESAPVHAVWLGSMILIFLGIVLRWPVKQARRLLRRQGARRADPHGAANHPGRAGWRIATVAAALNLLFLVAFPILFFGEVVGGIPAFVYGLPAGMPALLLLPWITGALALVSTGFAVASWRSGATPLPGRLAYSAAVLALLAMVPFAPYWRLVWPAI